MRFFGSIVNSEMAKHPIQCDSRNESVLILRVSRDTKIASRICGQWISKVLKVLRVCDFAKIFNSVVGPIVVFMVDVLGRKASVEEQPYKVMYQITDLLYFDSTVSVILYPPYRAGLLAFTGIQPVKVPIFITNHRHQFVLRHSVTCSASRSAGVFHTKASSSHSRWYCAPMPLKKSLNV